MIKKKMTCMTSNKVTSNTGSFSKKKKNLTNSHAYTGTCIATHDIYLHSCFLSMTTYKRKQG